MSLAALTSADAVLAAISEFDELSRSKFLEKYGFRAAHSYFILHNNKLYDSKAIVGAAHGFQYPDQGPLKPTDFSGGEGTVQPKLESLGFEVVGGSSTRSRTSDDTISKLLQQLLKRFADVRSGDFGEDAKLWSTAEGFGESLLKLPSLSARPYLMVKWSFGKGVWANVPWIAILNRNVTTSIQDGLYVVFLVAEDLSGVYLTLNQGITALVREHGQAAASREMLSRAETYRAAIQDVAAAGFALDNTIDLRSSGWRSKNYQLGTVAHLLLTPDRPLTDQELNAKLEALLTAYDQLALIEQSTPEEPAPGDETIPYTVEDALEDLFLDQAEVDRLLNIWRLKKNLVLQGAPGVGKSFVARRLAYALMGAKDDQRVASVQFHQSYGYEDFVQGYRPTANGGFELRDGVFYRFCEEARKDPRPHVFIIDEINRGNLSKIFGELMLLIEHDKRSADWATHLAYSSQGEPGFYVPDNVFVLGMMNTADRSLSMVDYALRRRFSFVPLEPKFTSKRFFAHLAVRGTPEAVIRHITDRMSALNATIAGDKANLGPGFQIGHSFFTPGAGWAYQPDWINHVVDTEIAPLLEEYWFDDPSKVDFWREQLMLKP